jgi:hypothetical protein
VLGFNIGAQVARDSTVPAGRVFLAGDLARIINPPTGGGLGGKTPRSPGRPQPGLEAVAAVLHGQAGPARYSIYLSHNERHQSDCSHHMQQQAFARFGSGMGKAPRCPTHRLRGGDDGLYRYGSSAVLGASEDISLLPLALNIVRSE